LNASYVAEHLLPLFEFAAQIIPEEYHGNTMVKYAATAGMRLLKEDDQEAVYDALFQGLQQADSFVFSGMKRDDIFTLSGDLEGYYGAVAANYLTGTVDANLHLISNKDNNSKDDDNKGSNMKAHPIGALDMGGSSTQIVYLTEQIDNGSHNCSYDDMEELADAEQEGEEEEEFDAQTCRLSEYEGVRKLQGDHFFSTSYLSYGVDQFRERLWNTLISDRQAQYHSDSCDTKMITYPCGFKGHLIEYEGYTFVGSGDADECVKQVQRLLPHPEVSLDNHHDHTGKTVGGIEHPPVSGKFFAMSLYFFTLDSLRVLSHPKEDAHEVLNTSWPRPSIDELYNALEGLCSRSWSGDLEQIQHNAHEFTRAEVLPHRCFESVYMVTLLRDGFGFHPESRDITFTFLVDGSEVEWSLGMALALFSDNAQRTDAETLSTNETCTDAEWNSKNSTTEKTRTSNDSSGVFSDSLNATLSHTYTPMASTSG
jgi:hypothetical protein